MANNFLVVKTEQLLMPHNKHSASLRHTDLLLHDMGSQLADDSVDFQASGTEWKTPALWGLGLIQTVNGHTNLMHDGRAKNVTEAILWHGGEGQSAKDKFKQLTTQDRTELLEFLNSL